MQALCPWSPPPPPTLLVGEALDCGLWHLAGHMAVALCHKGYKEYAGASIQPQGGGGWHEGWSAYAAWYSRVGTSGARS